MRVTVYTKPGCHLCEDALLILDRLAPRYSLEVNEVNILDDMSLYEALKYEIPVVDIEDGRLGRLAAPIDEASLTTAFEVARRANPPGTGSGPGSPTTGKSVVPSRSGAAIDRGISYIGRHWLRFALIAMGIFVGLPWLAPVFAALNLWNLANPIYTAYAFQCHQLPEREAHIFGYEVASCMRCNALYGGMFLFGLLYGLARDRDVSWLRWLRKPLPGWGFALMMLPILIDGISHMLGLRDFTGDGYFGDFWLGSQVGSLNFWLRIITGLLAGLAAVWFAAPRMDRSVQESESLRVIYQYSSGQALQPAPGNPQSAI